MGLYHLGPKMISGTIANEAESGIEPLYKALQASA